MDGEDTGAEDIAGKRHRGSQVDDDFFSLSDMERYLEKADRLSDPGTGTGVLCVMWTMSYCLRLYVCVCVRTCRFRG